MMAVTFGVDYVTRLLGTEGIDVHCSNEVNETALHLAVRAGSAPMVKALLDANANPAIVTSEDYETPMSIAASQGDIPLVEMLVKHGADVNSGHSRGYNAVHTAALYRHTEMLKILLESGGVEQDKLTMDHNSPLALAAYGKHGEAVDMLFPLGCNANNKDKDGY